MADFTPEKPQTIISIETAINSSETRLALQVLGKMGLSPQIIQSYEDLIRENPEIVLEFPIDEINNAKQFLGKEHFLSYRDRYAKDSARQVAAQAFYIATDYKSTFYSPGVKSRQDAALGPIPERYWPQSPSMAKRMDSAIQAGRLIAFAENLDRPRAQIPYGIGIKTHTFVQGMSEFLQTRFADKQQDPGLQQP